MAITRLVKSIAADSPGQHSELIYYRIGPQDATAKVYLQAALHADEQPGILILQHLIELLSTAEQQGLLTAEFVVMPLVNPMAMGNLAFGQHQGRYDPVGGLNYNRRWPDLYAQAGTEIAAALTADEAENTRIIRAGLASSIAALPINNARDEWRQIIMLEACDADYVFDLHCDDDALIHIYSLPQFATAMQSLANWSGAHATLLAEDSGGGSFDEMWPQFWIKLAAANTQKPVSLPVLSCTLEYRGRFDTFDDINRNDAQRLYAYFQSHGLIGGDLIIQPETANPPGDLRAMRLVRANRAGLVAFCVELGDTVKKGDRIADLIELDGAAAFISRLPVLAGTDGFILSRCVKKYVWRNAVIAKIVGTEILERSDDHLLTD